MNGNTRAWPRWVDELDRLLVVYPQFVVVGNIRDIYLTPGEGGFELQPTIIDCLWEALSRRGLAFLFVYDQIDGIRVHPESARASVGRLTNAQRDQTEMCDRLTELVKSGRIRVSLDKLPDWLRAVTSANEVPCAFIVDYASRLVSRPQELDEAMREFFTACEKISRATLPLRPPNQNGPPPYNCVIWLVNRPNDLPDWFVVGNEAIRTLVASLPDRRTRETAATATMLAEDFSDFSILPEKERSELIGLFADLTDGLTLRSMSVIGELARDQGMPLARVADAVRCYKVGAPDNPWRAEHLKKKIRNAKMEIGSRVKGQDQAIDMALDILIRSVMGLSGAQASARGGRPRGVLFFAGPTGVGKTELAKAITQQILGDEQAYKRFDMSEFSAEHSDARLIGAPPGYVGYDAGGELVNAIRQRPFSVLLFDEIEKAHPRILDKFLQILEDGRLTDGRGDTVFFSEAVIVFTSNLGMFEEKVRPIRDEQGRPVLDNEGRPVLKTEQVPVFNANSPPPYEQLEQKVSKAIKHYFRFELKRPELLNRIGDNIVIFNFISKEKVAKEIFEMMLTNVKKRVYEEHKASLKNGEGVEDKLLNWCTEDLTNGGRGIGNRLEITFVNPLSRALFDALPIEEGRVFTVQEVIAESGKYSVKLT